MSTIIENPSKSFNVNVQAFYFCEVEVEAASAEEAIKKAKEMYLNDDCLELEDCGDTFARVTEN